MSKGPKARCQGNKKVGRSDFVVEGASPGPWHWRGWTLSIGAEMVGGEQVTFGRMVLGGVAGVSPAGEGNPEAQRA